VRRAGTERSSLARARACSFRHLKEERKERKKERKKKKTDDDDKRAAAYL
jgi:hypothetical protein